MEEAYIDTGFEEENEVPSRKLTVGELRRGEREEELPCSEIEGDKGLNGPM